MRGSIENVSQLQKPLNDLQLENQISKNILDKAAKIAQTSRPGRFFLSVKFFTTTFYCVKFN